MGPEEGRSLHPTEYIDRNWEELKRLCSEREGVKEEVIYRSMHNTGARMGSLRLMDFDRPFDLGRAREIGFSEEMDTRTSWFGAFERVRRAGIML